MITKEEVQHIASLARIGLSEKEVEKHSKDISSILDWIEELKEVDIAGIEPTAHITGMQNRLREDNQTEFDNKGAIIDLFPEKKDGYGKVKSIL